MSFINWQFFLLVWQVVTLFPPTSDMTPCDLALTMRKWLFYPNRGKPFSELVLSQFDSPISIIYTLFFLRRPLSYVTTVNGLWSPGTALVTGWDCPPVTTLTTSSRILYNCRQPRCLVLCYIIWVLPTFEGKDPVCGRELRAWYWGWPWKVEGNWLLSKCLGVS